MWRGPIDCKRNIEMHRLVIIKPMHVHYFDIFSIRKNLHRPYHIFWIVALHIAFINISMTFFVVASNLVESFFPHAQSVNMTFFFILSLSFADCYCVLLELVFDNRSLIAQFFLITY